MASAEACMATFCDAKQYMPNRFTWAVDSKGGVMNGVESTLVELQLQQAFVRWLPVQKPVIATGALPPDCAG
jgi:hypothetical protein